MAEELKACPFCGRIPKTSHRPESEASGGGHVAFVACYCGGYASTAHQMGHAETVQAAIAEVVEKWNTRAQQPGQGGEAVEVVAYRYKEGHASWESENPWEPTTLSHGAVLLERKALAENGTFKGDERDYYLALSVEPLYTRPADQVAEGVVVSRELLVRLLDEGRRAETWAAQDELRQLLAKGEGVRK